MHISLISLLSESSEPSNSDGDIYFSESAWNIANGMTDGKSRSIIAYMSPDEFLTVAQRMPSNALNKFHERANEIKSLMSSGVKMSSLPQLSFEHDGQGTAKATSHDGRHRALSLKIMGVKSMPVVFTSSGSKKGAAIRWNEQRYPNSFDYYKGIWPNVLKGETSGEIPFPVKDTRTASDDLKENDEKHMEWRADWLKRHKATYTEDGRLIAYHGTPSKNISSIKKNGFRNGTYFSLRPEYSKRIASTYHDMPEDKITVLKVALPLDAIDFVMSDIVSTRVIGFDETIV